MPYTVLRPGGMTDADFIWYSRRLSQAGRDLGRMSRVLEPDTGRHWLAAWDDRAAAEAFAANLPDCTGHDDWAVAEADGVTEGPLGPLVVHLARQPIRSVVAVNRLSLWLLRTAFPTARRPISFAEIESDTLQEYLDSGRDLDDLVREVIPVLTGVSVEELEPIGFALVEEKTRETILFAAPASLVHQS